ncbi:hypothetical protein EDEG_04011 [Edhazardia aedis USNM 41457]|uniref:Uncharacterized protein n=1 Tax=Edhazardia aedis (strain USNM 41457) TaxID=1003232 RepID=J9DIZ3_EDHAE|nr:hypothetical protein EDEG_04011 [Edhazardia aedis USNM 41457]|eukprot:EJW01357.1 hypothetical protein EDEG_04011 [Edhazardia aedis USNM 41457]
MIKPKKVDKKKEILKEELIERFSKLEVVDHRDILVKIIMNEEITSYQIAKEVLRQLYGISMIEFGGLTKDKKGYYNLLILEKVFDEYANKKPYTELGKIRKRTSLDVKNKLG